MSGRGGRVLAAALALVAGALSAPAAASMSTPAPDDAGPAIALVPQAVTVGGPVTAIGVGWVPDSLVVVELCGNAAARGSLDCMGAQERGVDGEGSFHVTLTATPPPAPCPCVVAVTALGGDGPGRVLAPVRIDGVPNAQVIDPRPPPPKLDVTARLAGSPPLAAWFGAAHERTLVLTVRNVGTVPADLRLDVAVGPGDLPDTDVDTGEPPGRIAPGGIRVLRIPVEFEPLSIGHQVVVGEVAAPGASAPFVLGLDVRPWGLYAAAVVVLALAVAAALALLLCRRRRSAQPAPPPPEAQLALGPGPRRELPASTPSRVSGPR
jgi:hypothetical protein